MVGTSGVDAVGDMINYSEDSAWVEVSESEA